MRRRKNVADLRDPKMLPKSQGKSRVKSQKVHLNFPSLTRIRPTLWRVTLTMLNINKFSRTSLKSRKIFLRTSYPSNLVTVKNPRATCKSFKLRSMRVSKTQSQTLKSDQMGIPNHLKSSARRKPKLYARRRGKQKRKRSARPKRKL